MGRTLWLGAFRGVTLRAPGVGCGGINRPASAKALSTYLAFLRMLYPSTGALLIFLAANNGVMLWTLTLLSSSLGAMHGLTVAPPGRFGSARRQALIRLLEGKALPGISSQVACPLQDIAMSKPWFACLISKNRREQTLTSSLQNGE